MFKAIEQEKITSTMSVPALLQFMLVPRSGNNFQTLRRFDNLDC